MMYKNIVLDFGGTIIEYPTDEFLNKEILYSVLEDSKRAIKEGKIWQLKDIAFLFLAKKKIEKGLSDYKAGKAPYWNIYKSFNNFVLKGRSVSLINSAVDKYVRKSIDKVDKRILLPIQKARLEGKNTGILSVSYDYAIRKFLIESGFGDVIPNKNIVSNKLLSENGRACALTLDIYGRKAEAMEDRFFRMKGFEPYRTYYFGDTMDDEPIANLMPLGNFIVPFYANEDFKEYMASKHNARVPQGEQDLRIILKD